MLLDGLLILLYFGAITAIGLRMGRREDTLADFALGGRRIPWWAVMASVIAAETSAATFLGAPGEGYDKRSLAYVQLVLGVILGRVIVGNTFLKPFFTYRVYTVYEYLGIRFGTATKNYVSALFLLMRTLASGTRLFVPSLVMVLAWRLFNNGGQPTPFSQQAVSGVGSYLVAIIGLTIATCIYTALGGIKAVIWTDVIQATLMFGGALIAVVTLLYGIGGFHAVAVHVPQMTRIDGYFLTGLEKARVDQWKAEEHVSAMNVWQYIKLIFAGDYTLFSALIGTTLMNMAAFGTDQDMVQRLLTANTYKTARRSLITAAVMDLPIATAFTFIGILLYVYYLRIPAADRPATADVFGSYILNGMGPGVRGLVLAGLFATAMGSLSTALNSLATSATNDWYLPYRAKGRGEADSIRAARGFTLLFAVLMVLVAGAFAYVKVHDPTIRIIPVVLGIASFILGPMLGVFLLGIFTRDRGSDRGNLIAVTVGLLMTAVLGDLPVTAANLIGLKAVTHPAWLPHISFTWFATIGALTVFAVGYWFRTPPAVLEAARLRAAEAATSEQVQ